MAIAGLDLKGKGEFRDTATMPELPYLEIDLPKDEWPRRIEELEAAGLAGVTPASRAPAAPLRSSE